SEGRNIDLMLVSFAEAQSARDGVRALLNYIATDVGGTSALLIGISTPTPAMADTASQLMRAAFRNVLNCGGESIAAPAGGPAVSMFYGPEARLTCESARVLSGAANDIVARVVVGR